MPVFGPPVIDPPGLVTATLAGIAAWVPHTRIGPNSEPSQLQVENVFIPAANAEIALALGTLTHLSTDNPNVLSSVIVRAQHLAEYRVAIMILQAQNPEQSLHPDSLAMQMQHRFDEDKEELAKIVASGGNTPEAGQVTPAIGVSWSPPVTPLIINQEDPRGTSHPDAVQYANDPYYPYGPY